MLDKLTQRMSKEKNGEVPIWNVSTVHRKFLLKNPIKNWNYKQKHLIGVLEWSENEQFKTAVSNSLAHGTKFLVCVKMKNMKAVYDQSRLENFRKKMKHPFIWTIMPGKSKTPLQIAESQIFIPELEYDPISRSNRPLRHVF